MWSSLAPALVFQLRNVLESHGIPCEVRHELLSTVAGQVPPTECWVELWVLDDAHVEEARAVLAAAAVSAEAEAPPWRCPGCGEEVEATFGECWKCGASRV